jgi:hypothetical protein
VLLGRIGVNLHGHSDPLIAERAVNGKVSSVCSSKSQGLRFGFSKDQGKRMIKMNLKQLQDYQRMEAEMGKKATKTST